MKYIIGSAVVVLLCVIAANLITKQIIKKRPCSKRARIACTASIAAVFVLLIFITYFLNYHQAQDSAYICMESDERVTVREISGGWLFDGPGTEAVIVFYPGARVESQAYAPLMKRIADMGTDCVLTDPPFHFSLFDRDAIRKAYEQLTYDSWYIGGHSLGGLSAAAYASNNPGEIKGVILLGAYPVSRLTEESLLLITGTEDGCLSRREYERCRSLWPRDAQEKEISGGNHSGFGLYGLQTGDRKASITPAQQQEITAEYITAFVQR